MQSNIKLKPQCAGQDCEGNDGDQPAEESDNKTKSYVIGLYLFYLSVSHDQDRPEGTNPNNND